MHVGLTRRLRSRVWSRSGLGSGRVAVVFAVVVAVAVAVVVGVGVGGRGTEPLLIWADPARVNVAKSYMGIKA